MNEANLTTGAETARANWIACLPCLLLAASILVTGYFNNIAPAIRNGLFFAMLAAAAGFVVAVRDGGGITSLRAQRKKLPGRILPETPCRCERTEQIPDQARERAENWQQKTQTSVRPGASKTVLHNENRFARAAKTRKFES
jgi:hypothetical protein